MNRHLPLVQRVHPMLPGGGGEETVCAHCHEAWPCTVTVLLETLRDARAALYMVNEDHVSPAASIALDRVDAAIAKAEGR